jgi:hypothetical protein
LESDEAVGGDGGVVDETGAHPLDDFGGSGLEPVNQPDFLNPGAGALAEPMVAQPPFF